MDFSQTNIKNQVEEEEEERPLKAFITGYTSKPLKLTQLRKILISKYPKISEITMPKSSNKIWKGYAFVHFTTRPDFLDFIHLKRIRLEEFEMNIVIKAYKTGKLLKKYQKDIARRKVLVRNIPKYWDDQILENFFTERIGNLENAFITNTNSKRKFNIGYIIFYAKKHAKKCCEEKEFQLEDQHGEKLVVEYADEKVQEKKGNNQNTRDSERNGEELQGTSSIGGERRYREEQSSQLYPTIGNFIRGGRREERDRERFSQWGNNMYNPRLSYLQRIDEENQCHEITPTSKKYFQYNFERDNFCDYFEQNFRINLPKRNGGYISR